MGDVIAVSARAHWEKRKGGSSRYNRTGEQRLIFLPFTKIVAVSPVRDVTIARMNESSRAGI